MKICPICRGNHGPEWHALGESAKKAEDDRDQYKRERDEARRELAEKEKWLRKVCDELAAESLQRKERLEQAGALLREAKRCVFGDDANRIEREIDAFLAGQPAPVKLAVDDAMARVCEAAAVVSLNYIGSVNFMFGMDTLMEKLADLERARKGKG